MNGPAPVPPVRRTVAEVRAAARRDADKLQGIGPTLAGIAIVGVLMLAFIVLDYHFDQDPHRILKVALGVLAMGGIVAWPQFGLLLLPVVSPFLLWVPPTPIPGLNALNVLMFTVFGSFAFGRMMSRQPVFRKGRLGGAIGVLIGICALSIVRGLAFPTGYGYNAAGAVLILFRSAMSFTPYFIVLAMVRGRRWRARITWAVLLGLLAEALVTIRFGRSGAGARAVGSIGQSNELGCYLAMFSLVAAALVFGARRWWAKIYAAGVFAAGCMGIMLTVSRGSMAALVLGLAYVVWRSSRWVFLVMLFALVASPFWAPDYVKDRIMSSRVETTDADQAQLDASAEIRILTWRAIIDVVKHHPVDGVGFAGLQSVLPDVGAALGFADVKDSAHNTFLRMMGETGIFGLALFVWLLVGAWRLAFDAARRARQRFDRALAIGLGGAVLALGFSCAFGDRFWSPVVVSGFWILVALAEDAALEGAAGARP